MNKKPQLHCGACMREFNACDKLNKHLETCPAAKVLLPLIHTTLFCGDSTGHLQSRIIQKLSKNNHIIRMYSDSVACELDNITRSKIHHKLCDKLGFDYDTFRPFESSKIKELPTKKEAEEILWNAIEKELFILIGKQPQRRRLI